MYENFLYNMTTDLISARNLNALAYRALNRVMSSLKKHAAPHTQSCLHSRPQRRKDQLQIQSLRHLCSR